MTIRRATAADIPAIQMLLGQVLAVHYRARPDLFKAQGSKFSNGELEEIIANPNTPVFVYADANGTVLAHLFLMFKHKDSVLHPVKTLFVEDLCVDESARGQKIGEQLYDVTVNFAEENGCYNLTLHVWNDNEGALRFYEKRGMKAQSTTMEQIL